MEKDLEDLLQTLGIPTEMNDNGKSCDGQKKNENQQCVSPGYSRLSEVSGSRQDYEKLEKTASRDGAVPNLVSQDIKGDRDICESVIPSQESTGSSQEDDLPQAQATSHMMTGSDKDVWRLTFDEDQDGYSKEAAVEEPMYHILESLDYEKLQNQENGSNIDSEQDRKSNISRVSHNYIPVIPDEQVSEDPEKGEEDRLLNEQDSVPAQRTSTAHNYLQLCSDPGETYCVSTTSDSEYEKFQRFLSTKQPGQFQDDSSLSPGVHNYLRLLSDEAYHSRKQKLSPRFSSWSTGGNYEKPVAIIHPNGRQDYDELYTQYDKPYTSMSAEVTSDSSSHQYQSPLSSVPPRESQLYCYIDDDDNSANAVVVHVEPGSSLFDLTTPFGEDSHSSKTTTRHSRCTCCRGCSTTYGFIAALVIVVLVAGAGCALIIRVLAHSHDEKQGDGAVNPALWFTLNDNTYYVSGADDRRRYESARAVCHSLHAELVSILDGNTLWALVPKLPKSGRCDEGGTAQFWMALVKCGYDANTSPQSCPNPVGWYWLDGTPVVWTQKQLRLPRDDVDVGILTYCRDPEAEIRPVKVIPTYAQSDDPTAKFRYICKRALS